MPDNGEGWLVYGAGFACSPGPRLVSCQAVTYQLACPMPELQPRHLQLLHTELMHYYDPHNGEGFRAPFTAWVDDTNVSPAFDRQASV